MTIKEALREIKNADDINPKSVKVARKFFKKLNGDENVRRA